LISSDLLRPFSLLLLFLLSSCTEQTTVQIVGTGKWPLVAMVHSSMMSRKKTRSIYSSEVRQNLSTRAPSPTRKHCHSHSNRCTPFFNHRRLLRQPESKTRRSRPTAVCMAQRHGGEQRRLHSTAHPRAIVYEWYH